MPQNRGQKGATKTNNKIFFSLPNFVAPFFIFAIFPLLVKEPRTFRQISADYFPSPLKVRGDADPEDSLLRREDVALGRR